MHGWMDGWMGCVRWHPISISSLMFSMHGPTKPTFQCSHLRYLVLLWTPPTPWIFFAFGLDWIGNKERYDVGGLWFVVSLHFLTSNDYVYLMKLVLQ